MTRIVPCLASRLVPRLGLALTIAAAAVLTGGCASHTDDSLVDFQISGGFAGPRNAATLEIQTDGTATRTPSTGEPVTTLLDPAALVDLKQQIRDAQFPTLAPSYGCQGCADQAVYNISVSPDGIRYQVSVDEDAAGTPAGLQHLITTLHALALPPMAL